MVKKSAFTFIELIFAIVIIAISVVSLPTMTSSLSRGIESNLVQEAIFAASTELNQAISSNWDERSLEDGNSSLGRVVDDGTCETNSISIKYRLKTGHITQPYHRRCLDSNTTGGLGGTTTSVDALEDFAGTQTLVNSGGSKAGYKYTYSTLITVNTNAVFAGIANPNIKIIEANISQSGSLLTSLKTYSANIGEVDYYKRTY